METDFASTAPTLVPLAPQPAHLAAHLARATPPSNPTKLADATPDSSSTPTATVPLPPATSAAQRVTDNSSTTARTAS